VGISHPQILFLSPKKSKKNKKQQHNNKQTNKQPQTTNETKATSLIHFRAFHRSTDLFQPREFVSNAPRGRVQTLSGPILPTQLADTLGFHDT